MTRLDSTATRPKAKPKKPHPDYPLFPHGSGQWAKKVKQQLHYFGSWLADPTGAQALDEWLAQKDDILAGRKTSRRDSSARTVDNLFDLFLESRERRRDSGELSPITFRGYSFNCKLAADKLGKTRKIDDLRPEDFAELRDWLGDGCNLKSLEGRVATVRAVFNHADKNGWLDKPLSRIWGTEFSKPSATVLKKLKAQTVRLFTAGEVWQLLAHAGPQLRAMIHLGLNCGFGPTDIGRLKQSDIDWTAGYVTLNRSKTGQHRRCPLWPESISALKLAIAARPEPKDPADAELVFLTKYRGSWLPTAKPVKKKSQPGDADENPRLSTTSPLSSEFRKLAKNAGIYAKGKTFYTLRHCLQTIGDETRDFVAVSSIMGHATNSISDNYREKIGDDRLLAVVNQVRKWLLAGKPKKSGKARRAAR